MSTKVDLTSARRTFYGTGMDGIKRVRKSRVAAKVAAFLNRENIYGKMQATPVKERVTSQLAAAMKRKKISKSRMAVLLKTSRSQVDRILDPKRDSTVGSLQRAAALVGRHVVIQLV